MKFTKLLVLGALLLMGGTAQAALDANGERIKPTPQSVPFQTGTTSEVFYLYNTGAQKFFTEGNDWGTRASVADTGLKIYFSEYSAETTPVTYQFNDYSVTKASWKVVFFNDENSMYVDRGNQANYGWAVTPTTGDAFRLSVSTQASGINPTYCVESYPGKYVGLDESLNGTALSPLLDEGEGHHIEWTLVTEAAYADYGQLIPVYNASVPLLEAIKDAEAAGVDVSAEKAVYQNESSTIDELKAATVTAKQKAVAGATGLDPKDVTSAYLTNATFDVIGDFTGWSGMVFTAGGTKSTNAEWYEKDGTDANPANAYQDAENLLPGYYVAGVRGFYRAGNSAEAYINFKAQNDNAKKVSFYVTANGQDYQTIIPSPYKDAPTKSVTSEEANATDNETGVTYYIPNTMAAAEYYMHKQNLYANYMMVKVGADGKLRIGVRKTNGKIDKDWAIFDDFQLIYAGTGEDAYAALARLTAGTYPTFEGEVLTQSLLDAYLAALANTDAQNAINSQAGVDALVAQLDAAKEEVKENISLWKQFEALVAQGREAYSLVANSGSEEADYLNAYVNDEADANSMADYVDLGWEFGPAINIIKARALNNEQLKQQIAILEELIANAKSVIPAGSEVTNMLVNPDFTNGREGWTGWGVNSNKNGNQPTTGGSPNVCAEAYEANDFDFYQVVNGLGVGVYEVKVQGFSRRYRNDGNVEGAAWTNYKQTNGADKLKVYVYLNDNTSAVKDVHDEPQTKEFYSDTSIANFIDAASGKFTGDIDSLNNGGYFPQLGADDLFYVPNTMSAAGYAFAKGIYQNSTFGAVVNKGDSLRLGVKGSTDGANWSIYDNFKLIFWGKQADKVLAALQAAIVDVQGRQAGNMTVEAKQAVAAALAAAQASAQNDQNDGDKLFAALSNLYAAKAQIVASEGLLNRLQLVNDSLLSEWQTMAGATRQNLLTAARDLNTEVRNALMRNEISESEISGYLEQIAAYRKDIATYQKLIDAVDELDGLISDLNLKPKDAQGNLVDGWVTLKEEILFIDDVNARLEAATLPVSEVEELLAKFDGFKAEVAKFEQLNDAYIELVDATDEAAADMTGVNATAYAEALTLLGNLGDALEAGTIDVTAVDEWITNIHSAISRMYQPAEMEFASDEQPVNLTSMIKHPGFEEEGTNNIAGWQNTTGYNFGNNDTQKSALLVEFFNKKFDLYQTFYDMPAGVYEVRANAFYRFGSTEADYKQYVAKADTANAFIYGISLRDSVRSSAPLKLLFAGAKNALVVDENGDVIGAQSKYGISETDTLFVPNDMVSAKAFFSLEEKPYQNSVYFRLAERGDLAIGVRQNDNVSSDWVIMDDFELYYYGSASTKQPADDPSGIENVAAGNAAKVVRSEYFNLGGARTLAPQKGIVIVRQTLSNGDVVIKKMNLK